MFCLKLTRESCKIWVSIEIIHSSQSFPWDFAQFFEIWFSRLGEFGFLVESLDFVEDLKVDWLCDLQQADDALFRMNVGALNPESGASHLARWVCNDLASLNTFKVEIRSHQPSESDSALPEITCCETPEKDHAGPLRLGYGVPTSGEAFEYALHHLCESLDIPESDGRDLLNAHVRANCMYVEVQTTTGEEIAVPIFARDTKALEVKRLLGARLGRPSFSIKLVGNGRLIPDAAPVPQAFLRDPSSPSPVTTEPRSPLVIVPCDAIEHLSVQTRIAAASPGARSGHSLTRISDNLLICFGGVTLGAYLNSVFIYNLAKNEWREVGTVGSIPEERTEHTAFKFQNRLYVFGGRQLKKWFNDVYSLDLETFTWRLERVQGRLPPPRARHGGALIPDKGLYFVYGGYGDLMQPMGDLRILNLETMVWAAPEWTGRDPPPLAGHVCSPVGSKIYVTCGVTKDSIDSNVFVLDTDLMKWEHLVAKGQPPTPRSSQSCVVMGKKLVVFGGTGRATDLFDSFHVFNTETSAWSQPELSSDGGLAPRGSQAAAKVGNTMFVCGGDDGMRIFNLETVHFCRTFL